MSEECALSGYRILDLTDDKGAYGARILADLGADVIKVEPPQGDKSRAYPPFWHNEIHPEKSLYFLFYNFNKRSISLNIEHKEGQEIFKELVKQADGVFESFPVGYLKGLGLDYESLKDVNSRLIMVSVTHFGQNGPWKDFKSCDLIDLAMGGLPQMTGESEGSPMRLGLNHAYAVGSQWAALGFLTALNLRHLTGEGDFVDVSIQEATATMTGDSGQATTWFLIKENPSRRGIRFASVFPGGGYQCKDGWILAGLMSAGEWEAVAQWFYEVTGSKEWLEPMYKGGAYARAQYKDYLDEMACRDFFPRFTKDELFKEAQRRGLAWFPFHTVEEMVKDPQLNARGFFQEFEQPCMGKVKLPKLPFHSKELTWSFSRPAPALGQHNEEVYGEIGLSQKDIVTLKGAGII